MSQLYSRLGTRADVDRRIQEAEEMFAQGYDILVVEDIDAETVKIVTDATTVTMLSALHKGGGVWLCVYNRAYYPES